MPLQSDVFEQVNRVEVMTCEELIILLILRFLLLGKKM